jgi:rod shape-determining protein MreC
MSGFSQQQGILEYIKGEQQEDIKDQELIVVTSGSGGVFKSGIPVGKINLNEFVSNNQMVVDFYKDFSQLKYVKISSYQKDVKLDQSSKKIYNEGKSQILKINHLIEEIKVLKQQKIIADEIRNKFENENTELKQGLIKAQRELIELNKNIDKVKKDKEKIKFLELNLLYGPKCRKTFLKSSLFKIGTPEYKNCVLNQGVIKN